MQKNRKSYEDYMKVKPDVKLAYIQLFGEEKGKELINKLMEEKKRIWRDEQLSKRI